MQSSKYLAIAVLAMVVVPIGAGYCLSMEEVDRTGWRTTQEYNITDRILNTDLPYYLPVSSPINNGLLLDNGGFTSPDYVTIGNTPSSIPVYSTQKSRLDASGTTIATTSAAGILFHSSGQIVTDGYSTVGNNIPLRINLNSGLVVSGANGVPIYSGITSIIVSPYSTDSGVGWVLTTISNGALHPGIGTIHDMIVVSTASGNAESMEIVKYTPATINNRYWSIDAKFSTTSSNFVFFDVVRADGSHYYASSAGGMIGIGSSGVVNIFGLTDVNLDNVTSISRVVLGPSVQFYANTPTGQYADPADGWRFPATTGTARSGGVWSAGTPCSDVTMLISPSVMLGNASLTLSIRSTIGSSSVADVLTISASGANINGSPFAWPARITAGMPFIVNFSENQIKITIIDSWPSMGSDPVSYGSITLDRSSPGVIFGIAAEVQDYNLSMDRWTFRVDSASILAGRYPATKDATLDLTEILGESATSVKITSIGVYGDSITIAGVHYPVTDGTITVGDSVYRLLNMVIGITPGDGAYILTINGDQIGSSATYPTISFDGVWSLALRGWSMEQFTTSDLEWVPGKYGLDDKSASLVGVMAAVGVFIALALCRPFSGSKIIMLAIVCFGGVLFFIIFI